MSMTVVRRQSSLLRAHSFNHDEVLARLHRLPSLKPTTMVPLPSPVFWDVEAIHDIEAEVSPTPSRNRLAGALYMLLGLEFHVWLPMNAFTHALIHDNAMLVPFTLLVVLLGTPLLLFPVLVCLKVDGTIAASWCMCFTPLWIVHAIDNIYCPWLAHVKKSAMSNTMPAPPSSHQSSDVPASPQPQSPSSPMPTTPADSSDDMHASTTAYSIQATAGNFSRASSLASPQSRVVAAEHTTVPQPDSTSPPAKGNRFNGRDIVMTVCVVAAEVMVALRLDGFLASVPWVVVFGCPLVVYYGMQWNDTSFTWWFRDCLFHVAQVIFVALKADGFLTGWSWATVFLPTWLAATIVVYIVTHDAWVALYRTTEPEPPLSAVGRVLVIVAVVWYFVPYILVVASLDGIVTFPSILVVLVPWLVVVGGWISMAVLAALEDDQVGSPDILPVNRFESTGWYIVLPWTTMNVWLLLLMVAAVVYAVNDGGSTTTPEAARADSNHP
ncbi:hypothetical protein, variant 1 [Aphanomyces invadans]|uniref:Transmembrane protein n=1 Tax=Aphanomyces invadans TaxID=157072 RepID=A0A024TZ67_9STRA|nr:hypothetical protein, variant 1 [Aphanomyces invadans]ETV98901.1 hypothetical protein, variant 1 [Aphanomyces invadans]|eukprot:XP_008872328.1 hypothetical protein, variant 1 [Aphanomyces invadans]